MKLFVAFLGFFTFFCTESPMAIPAHAQAQTLSKAGEPFYKQISQINRLVQKGHWKAAEKETSALRKMYQKKKWKLQLIGDEGEYEGLDREMDRLSEAVSAKDKAQTKVELGAIRSLIRNIYSL